MKIINKRSLTVLLTLALLFATTIGLSTAYFSATDEATATATVALKQDTTIDEGGDPAQKQIVINNSEDGAPVVVRVQVLGPDEPLMTVTPSSDSKWVKGTDGWYYCTVVLAPGAATPGKLVAKLKDNLTDAEKFELGDNFNVIVVHEAQIATYDGASVVTPSGWDQSITFTEN